MTLSVPGRVLRIARRWRHSLLKRVLPPKSLSALLSASDIVLDDDYLRYLTDAGFQYRLAQVVRLPLKELLVHSVFRPGGPKELAGLAETPNYLFLQGRPEAYDELLRHENHHSTASPLLLSHGAERFQALADRLDAEGFDERRVIVVNYNNEVLDGRHRACWLYHRFGGDHAARVLRIVA